MSAENRGLDQAVRKMLVELGEELDKSKGLDSSAKGLAFWLRESNLKKMDDAYLSLQLAETSFRKPVGRIFQVAPSNVDLLFTYTWALALLTGNTITTKLGSKIDSTSLDPVLEILNRVLQRHPGLGKRTEFFSADRQDPRIPKEIEKSDLILAWGSDDTIQKLQSHASSVGKTFVGFPHRFSCALINVDLWRESNEREQANLLARFVSEVSAFDQGACTSPKTLFVVGNRHNREFFVDRISQSEIDFSANQASGYLRFVNKVRLQQESGLRAPVPVGATKKLELIRGVQKISQVSENRCVLGMLPLIDLDSIEELAMVMDREIQTLSIWGYGTSEVASKIARHGVQPLRMVRIGSTHSFNFVWDGINLLSTFSWPQQL